MFRKISITMITLFILAGCSFSNYWILEKERLSELPKVSSHVDKVQQDYYSDTTGFTVFTISEGRRMTVISTGNNSIEFELVNVNTNDGNTEIIVKEIDSNNSESNPTLLIGLKKIKGELQVYNQTQNKYLVELNENMEVVKE